MLCTMTSWSGVNQEKLFFFSIPEPLVHFRCLQHPPGDEERRAHFDPHPPSELQAVTATELNHLLDIPKPSTDAEMQIGYYISISYRTSSSNAICWLHCQLFTLDDNAMVKPHNFALQVVEIMAMMMKRSDRSI